MNKRMYKKMFFVVAALCISTSMFIGANGCDSGIESSNSTKSSSLSKDSTYPVEGGYPSDWPPAGHDLTDPEELIGGTIGGFGGDASKTRSEHSLSRRPIILVHGNGGSAVHDTWGFQYMVPRLIDLGYKKDEIWAISYLGTGSTAMPPDPYAKNVDDFRRWIAAVMDYLSVDKVDIITHSLGGGLVRGWIEGYTSSQTYGADTHRDEVGTVWLICAANYGFDGYNGEWEPTHTMYNFNNSSAVAAVKYISVRAIGDFVDNATPYQTPTISGFGKSTSLLVGAYLNFEFNVPEASGITSPMVSGPGKKHANAIRWEPLFTEAIAPYLESKSISFDPSSATLFEGSLTVNITVNGYASASYTAKDDQGTVTDSGSLNANGTTAITITETTTFDVSALAEGSSTPETKSSPTYTKDAGLPVITFNPTGGDVSKDTVVSISADRNTTQLRVTYNGNTDTISGSTASVTLDTEGTFTIAVEATNAEGTSNGSETYTVTSCTEVSASNDDHVTAGRAYTETSAGWWWLPGTTTYYAQGSGDNLGTSGSTSTTLYSSDGSSWSTTSCNEGGDGDGDGDCSGCSDYACCVGYGCAGYSYVDGGMKCYVMSGYSMTQCSCWK